MLKLGMEGPYGFNTGEINLSVRQKSPGNYALGYIDKNGKFIVKYIGRADVKIREVLRQKYLELGSKYSYFKYSAVSMAKTAFDKECKNYHEFSARGTLDNEVHPQSPSSRDWKCSYCPSEKK